MAKYNPLLRQIDFWCGVPLVVLAGLLRRRRPLPVSPQRVGVISPTAIGDLVLATGVLTHLRKTYPRAEIHLFHGPPNAGVVPLLPFEMHTHVCDFSRFAATLAAIRGARLDLLTDLAPWPRLTALCAALSGAVTVGYDSQRQRRHYAYDFPVRHRSDRHEVENMTAIANVFAPCGEFDVNLRRDPPLPVQPLPYERLVLFHIAPGGSRADDKSWPAEHWADLARRLAGDGFVIGFTGIRADAAKVEPVMRASMLRSDQVLSLCGSLSLAELAGAIKASRLLVTIDTGVLHLASALHAPTLALHGPTRSDRWGGRSAAVTSLNAPHAAAGFIHLGFEYDPRGPQIMRTLSVDAVYRAARGVLESNGGAR
jgi:ADP-heptose:LPS heptosyltransferase